MIRSLDGAVAVITGAGSGIGRAVGVCCDVTSDDELLILTDPVAAAMLDQHARDREGFLRSQIDYVEGGA